MGGQGAADGVPADAGMTHSPICYVVVIHFHIPHILFEQVYFTLKAENNIPYDESIQMLPTIIYAVVLSRMTFEKQLR